MSLSDPLGDMLTRIRNGQSAHKSSIRSPASKLRMNVLEVLQREGYIRGYMREPEERFEATLALAKLPRNGARTRVRNRCALTGRPRGYHRKFGLSRIALRDLGSTGQIPGLVKASW